MVFQYIRMSMRKFVFSLIFLILFVFTSCEKHDGIQYFKAKCIAELNGITMIDQTPFNIGPNSTNTPSFEADEYNVDFLSSLSNERGGAPVYIVHIKLFVDKPWEYLTQPEKIHLVNIGHSDEVPTSSDYIQYCKDNRISYATILSCSDYTEDIITNGSFEITSYDIEKNLYKGIFSLDFSQGTLTGEFTNVKSSK